MCCSAVEMSVFKIQTYTVLRETKCNGKQSLVRGLWKTSAEEGKLCCVVERGKLTSSVWQL